jgi:two-component system, sensor histidine kinase and response regulator
VSFAEGETQRYLRKQIPIVALTANAVVGMREMFIENGFNDFLAKPIDVSKLDEMLNRWIAKDKRVVGNGEWGMRSEVSKRGEITNTQSPLTENPLPTTHSPLPSIPGVDIQKGIAMTGGTVVAYKQVLSMFSKDAEDRMPFLQALPKADTMNAFVTQVHAMKSASASIGAAELSERAAALEAAGKAGDMVFIQENLAVFAESLSELINNIRLSLEQDKYEYQDVPHSPFPTPHSLLFEKLAETLKSQNASEVDRILDELNQKPLDSNTRETVEKISDEVLLAEYDKAAGILDSFLKQRKDR